MSHSQTGNALNDYQADALRSADMGNSRETRLAVWALGLGGEAGEVQELIKKHLGHGRHLDRNELVKELGDVLWYIAALAQLNGIYLSEIANRNIAKLRERYPDGFVQGGGVR